MSGAIAIGFFTSAAAGILTALLLASFQELGRFFFVLNAFLAFLLLCIAAPYRVTARGAAPGVFLLALLAMILVIAYLAALLLLRAGRASTGLLVAAAAAALLATAADGWTAADAAAAKWIFSANALAAAALLGAVTVAMLMGHWYLVRTRLDVSHLVRFARLYAVAVAARAAFLIVGLLGSGLRSPSGLEHFLKATAVDRGFFFWQRLLFGILGPAACAGMVYETARIRSTQSATGILYIAVIFVVYGEFLARYLAVAGAGPM
ncbi:MAG: hypothetical protein AUH92_05525 [Acidobacteria bacterium 13_1_40CM_4_69_4]|nr:MAG: hypothetical protein AUH92_05525 [Acidobacteria bacterium 13_1_40CM_4_69_4]